MPEGEEEDFTATEAETDEKNADGVIGTTTATASSASSPESGEKLTVLKKRKFTEISNDDEKEKEEGKASDQGDATREDTEPKKEKEINTGKSNYAKLPKVMSKSPKCICGANKEKSAKVVKKRTRHRTNETKHRYNQIHFEGDEPKLPSNSANYNNSPAPPPPETTPTFR